ncbi:MAG TPA: Clp protease N-terminal domain-containing protein, partial [Ktedonobacteraceae bacterium]|nr:Clp protease N-terminal domain-containing protein [Ktedonobacteraceae bacterium]
MTSEEIAELLHVDPVTVRRLVNKGELSAYRIGADYRFAPSDLTDYLQRQRIPARTENESGSNPNNPLDQFTQLFRKIIQGKHTTPLELLNRFDRFTKRARHVLTLAQEEAQRFQHNYIGTEHLLLGLLDEGEGVAAQVLNNLGIEVDQVRHAVEAIIGRGGRIVAGEVGITPRAKKVIELAMDEARRLNHHFIGTEHLLLGLIREGDGIAAGVLENLGLQLGQVRSETLQVLRQHQQEPEQAPAIPPVPSEATTLLAEDEPGLTCTSCGAHSPGYFRYCFNCAQ